MKIKVSKKWYEERLTPALLQWRAGAAREKAKSIILDLLKVQRECGKQGVKNLFGRPVVSVSSRMVSAWYRDYASQKKFIHWVESTGLVLKDRHWVNLDLAKEIGLEPCCDSWHVTEADFSGSKIEVRSNDTHGLFSIYKKAIDKAEGTKVDDAHFFHGRWAVDSYVAGKMSWTNFVEVGKAAHNVIKGEAKTKGPSCRVFDAVSMCKKTLRGRCFTDADGNESKEVFDIPAAITFTAPLALAAFGLSGFADKDVCEWATALSTGATKDPYETSFQKALELDPKTNVFGTGKKWTKATRKKVKIDFQVVSNCDLDYMAKCDDAYNGYLDGNYNVSRNKRRQWLIWHAIREANKPFADSIVATKTSGVKDAFYRLHTTGEKMIINVVIKELGKRGIVVHRVHDALWSADKRLTALTDKQIDALIGRTILQFLGTPCDRLGIQKLVREAGITKAEAAWVLAAISGGKRSGI